MCSKKSKPPVKPAACIALERHGADALTLLRSVRQISGSRFSVEVAPHERAGPAAPQGSPCALCRRNPAGHRPSEPLLQERVQLPFVHPLHRFAVGLWRGSRSRPDRAALYSIFILDFFSVCFIMVLCKSFFAWICRKSKSNQYLRKSNQFLVYKNCVIP